MQNNDLIMSLEKTEQLLAIAQKTSPPPRRARRRQGAVPGRDGAPPAPARRPQRGALEAQGGCSPRVVGHPRRPARDDVGAAPADAGGGGRRRRGVDHLRRHARGARRRGRREHVRAADRVGEAAARVLRGDADDLPLARLLPARHAGDADAPGALARVRLHRAVRAHRRRASSATTSRRRRHARGAPRAGASRRRWSRAPTSRGARGQGVSKVSKVAQLFATVGAPAGGAKVVGSLVYEMRMRRRVDVAVHAFLQRFPEVAELALAPVLPGARTKEAGDPPPRRAACGSAPAADVVGRTCSSSSSTSATTRRRRRRARTRRYEQERRFPVDMSADFVEYLKQASMRGAVFDDNERDDGDPRRHPRSPSPSRRGAERHTHGARRRRPRAGALTLTARRSEPPRPSVDQHDERRRQRTADADTAAAVMRSRRRSARAARRPGDGAGAITLEGAARWRSPRRRSRRTR